MALAKKSTDIVLSGGGGGGSGKVKPKVLEEDDYLEKLETIIQRDFYPDIAKLKAQTEYFDAVQSNDVEKIKQLQEKFSSRRTDKPINTPRSPAFFETPDISRHKDVDDTEKIAATPVEQEPSTSKNFTDQQNVEEKDNESVSAVDNVTLDKFVYKFTSEDNSSFEEIMSDSERKLREKHAWMYKAEAEHKEKINTTLALRQADEQLAIEGPRHAGVDNWTYKAQNAVMFIPDGVEWTPDEKVQRQKLSERVIVHENTRITTNPYGDETSTRALTKAATIQAAVSKGKVDAQGNEIGLGKFSEQFGFVATPSPAPGVNESPMMTWGEIEGTPFRLDAGDTVIPKTPGPVFKMPEVPLRDQLAQCITEEMAKKHRQKKQSAIKEISARTPTTRINTKSMERLTNMSPAAQRLATAKLGIRVGTDKALKATYSPSPLRIKTPSKTPLLSGTPSSDVEGRSSLKRPIESETPQTESLTDNLLNLQPKKPRAADYF